jgi:hypothetical protein
MTPPNQIGHPSHNGDCSSRSVIHTVDGWLALAGLPTYSELEERLKAQASASQSSQLADLVPEPPEFESLPPAQPKGIPVAIPRELGRSIPQVKLTEVQKLILQRGVTGFRRNGGFKWVCEQGEVKRDYLLLRRHGLIRSVRLCSALAIAFATDEGRRVLDEDADRF